ncbi:MAG: DJ-1/PfpI family protein [Candidatus Accumulibacter sp.]|jgi:cyclohexyl-isocyanide hydratase|nr:DJ-1/PfpI family protein [Accumulibacter sp.]
MNIGFLLFPDVLQMDLTGPYGVLAAGPGARVCLVWKDARPVRSSDGLVLTPGETFAGCPPLDVICVPGGGGILPLLSDGETLAFLRARAESARFVCSVCTGALVLGAAGLLKGRRATTHWQSHELLRPFGAIPERARVVRDGNLLTAAGVSAGIDMALTLAGLLWGDDIARRIQLNMEYAPEPPYAAGTPESAPPQVVQTLTAQNADRLARRREAVLAAARLL